MSGSGNPNRALRVAIVGAGPAGFYVLQHLLRAGLPRLRVDMFDRLPTPFGLVRQGVAPDHQAIKSVIRVFDKLAREPSFRFFGNVDFGKDLTLDDLRARYDQVVFATGAQADRKLNIPGEDLQGSYGAAAFVAWYNGHPDYSHLQFDLSGQRSAVIGLGNVAVDVARLLCRNVEELRKTDIANEALEALSRSSIEEVYLLGRRGPAEAAFTNHEINELSELAETEVRAVLEPAEVKDLERTLDSPRDRHIRNKLDTLHTLAGKGPKPGAKHHLLIRFLVSPLELLGDSNGHVRAIRLAHNKLYRASDGKVRARNTGEEEIIETDVVFRAVGYRGMAIPGLPFRHDWGTIPNEKGRVIDPASGKAVPGTYVSGWIKRGPTGVIGTNKPDARETVTCMVEDYERGHIPGGADQEAESIETLLKGRGVRSVTYEDWLDLDRIELIRGQVAGRPRVKFTTRAEFLEVLEALEPPLD